MPGGIAVPLALEFGPLALKLLVLLVEKLFPPKSGPTKLSLVVQLVQLIVQFLATAGLAGGAPPDITVITADVQKMVDALQAAGKLKGADTVIEVPAGVPPERVDRMLAILENLSAASLGGKP